MKGTATVSKKRIFIVEDHPIFRMGLIELINQESDMVVCGEAETVSDARKGIANCEADMVVVDLGLKNSSGMDLIREFRVEGRKVPILVLSMHDESIHAQRCILAGASGYIMKQETSVSVVKAIRHILAGSLYVSEKVMTRLLNRLRGDAEARHQSPMDELTDRELEVFQLIGGGLTSSDIARRLNLSVKTVGTHRERIKEKLGCRHGGELVRLAVLWTEKMLPSP